MQRLFKQIYQYNAGKRCGPGEYNVDLTLDASTKDSQESCQLFTKDLAWLLCRISSLDKNCINQTVPSWTGYNMVAADKDVPPKSIVGYNQMIDASPTDLSTVYTLLKRSDEMAIKLGLSDTVVVLDQAIYAKALEVVWKKKEELSRVVLRMGSFHIACVFLAVIGKRFGDSGLADLLLESNLIGSGSLKGVLNGKHYNRAVRVHKVIYHS